MLYIINNRAYLTFRNNYTSKRRMEAIDFIYDFIMNLDSRSPIVQKHFYSKESLYDTMTIGYTKHLFSLRWDKYSALKSELKNLIIESRDSKNEKN